MTPLLMRLSFLFEVVIFMKLGEKNGEKQCYEQTLTATLTSASDRNEGTTSLVIKSNFFT